jgi:hypothetical protein
VHVKRDVTPSELINSNIEISLENLNCHGGLFLADPRELLQSALQFLGCRRVSPDLTRISAIPVDHQLTRRANPVRHVVDVPMQRDRIAEINRLTNRGWLGRDSCRIQVAKSLPKEKGSFPGALGRDSLVKDHGKKKRERIVTYQRVRDGVAAERGLDGGLIRG